MPFASLIARTGSLLPIVLRGGMAGVLLALGLHFGFVLLGGNVRTSVPGLVYRCGQLSPRTLQRLIRQHGIRTVINLRGCAINADWYRAEAKVTGNLGVSQEDIWMSASRLPSTISLRQLIEVLERTEYPILVHCHQGADRTGITIVAYHLLRTDATLNQALRHMGPASGHLPVGRTWRMDWFFRMYRDWLVARGEEHTPDRFRLWALEHYCPDVARADFTLVEASAGTLNLPPATRKDCTVRCRNTSGTPWRFQPGANAGIHLWSQLFDHTGRQVWMDRAGLFKAEVAPGERIDLTIPLGPLSPGRYELRADLVDEQHGWFAQFGNAMLSVEVIVP